MHPALYPTKEQWFGFVFSNVFPVSPQKYGEYFLAGKSLHCGDKSKHEYFNMKNYFLFKIFLLKMKKYIVQKA